MGYADPGCYTTAGKAVSLDGRIDGMTTDGRDPKALNTSDKLVAAGVILAPFLMIASVMLYGEYSNILDVRKCDAKITERLKAPSTYERVSFDHLYGQEYRIEYDAQNSFGVPLRGKGYCTVNGASAEWLELP